MNINTDPKKIEELLVRGVHDVFTLEELKKKLLSGKQLHVKLGTDVTGSDLHLGHSVIHRKIRDFQELGHRVTLIIGDFTTLVGDHSDKVDMREETSPEKIKEFEKTYQDQFFKTVLRDGTEIRHNSEWLSKLSFGDAISLAKQFTVSQMLDRETFLLRYREGKPIGLDEFLYPIMQGYDSVALNSDVELGGTDQTFNLLAGRKLMPVFGQEPQNAITMKLLLGSDGRPMGKSLKNFIPINDQPEEMYGKIMAVVDGVIFDYFELVTRVPMEDVLKMKEAVLAGENPMKFKKILAKEIVTFYHGQNKALIAEEDWESKFQKGEIPEVVDEIQKRGTVMQSMFDSGLFGSNSDIRRLFKEGAVKNLSKDKKVDEKEEAEAGDVYRVGKHKFIKII